VSSPETQVMAALALNKTKALAELEQIEAAMFRFSHRVRAFLAAWPEDMPPAGSVVPRFQDRRDDTTGERGGKSYVQLVYGGRQGVEAWAARWGTDVTSDPTAYSDGAVYVSAESDVDGLHLVASGVGYANVDGEL